MDQLNFNSENFKENKGRTRNRFFLIIGFIVIGYIVFNTALLDRKFEVENKTAKEGSEFDAVWFKRFANLLFFNQNQAEEIDTDYIMPEKEPSRLDILILGIRGEYDENDEGAGALLTDTMMVFSHDQLTKKSSLVSIPRDLYVKTDSTKNKINAAY